jgi:hypothetical protein
VGAVADKQEKVRKVGLGGLQVTRFEEVCVGWYRIGILRWRVDDKMVCR